MTSLQVDRQEVITTLHHLQSQGKGNFIVGRKGFKSRFVWKHQDPSFTEAPKVSTLTPPHPIAPILSSPPNPAQTIFQSVETKPTNTALAEEQIKQLAHLTGMKEKPTFETLSKHLDRVMKELYQLRDNVVVEEPPGIVHIERKFLEEDQWVFWPWDMRKAIAHELLAYRRNK